MTPIITVAVRASDGACFHWQEGMDYRKLRKLKQLSQCGSIGIGAKWTHLIRQLQAYRKECTIRLIIGFDGDSPVFDELTYKPRGNNGQSNNPDVG